MLLDILLVCLTYGFGLGTTKCTCYRKLYLLFSDGLTEGQPVWVWGAPDKWLTPKTKCNLINIVHEQVVLIV